MDAVVGKSVGAAVRTLADPVIVLRGITLDARLDWVYAPRGWDATELERRSSICPQADESRPRRCLMTPTGVRQLIALYGQEPVVALSVGPSLSELLDRHTLVVDVLLAAR